MVLAQKVGRPRSFWHVFLLSTVTFGVYWFYWAYRSQDEVYRQFELAREGRDEGVVWLMFGNFLPFLRYIYYYRYVSNTRYLRQRFGFAQSLGPGAFLGLSLTAGAVFTVLALVGLSLMGAALDTRGGDIEVLQPGLLAAGYVVLAVAAAQWGVLKALALRSLQSDVNGIWAAYDQRAAFIRQGRPAQVAPSARSAAPPGAPPAGTAAWPRS
ncbi:MAG: DUF4234 domain-containing protein [Halobacteriales archaeon]|nr:DUF4234 domain-containing protein [Halobacteriales archaeon]